MFKKGLYNESIEIDEELKELIKTMNKLDWVETSSCCIGHTGHQYHDEFYIQFFCDVTKVSKLSQILNDVQSNMLENHIPVMFKCEFNFYGEVFGGQHDAPKGSIAFYLTLGPLFELNVDAHKTYIVECLYTEFLKEVC